MDLARSRTTARRLRAAYVVVAAADTLLAGTGGERAHRARLLSKPLLMPLLAASLATDPRAATSPLRTTTLVAEAGGWGGDVLLLGEGPGRFMAGAGSFAVGHAAYIRGFRDRSRARCGAAPVALAALWVVTTPPLALAAARQDRRLGASVAAYSAVLSSMVAAATRVDGSLGPAARRSTVAGAGLFLFSDAIIGLRELLLEESPRRLESAVMLTYAAAQLLLADGAARAGAPALVPAVSRTPG
ncbi:putative membrane protein YhhN [Nocardioides marinisabuli]|uniref:Putative membrane protein YhhN n=1 Tax=Nocardioides marinisabuli TaxID=419476 RepID=A0A7Y9JNZ2_9ACTN|nr:lysoplasmalogenase [Nocardioides marinisabuli]NYD55840.1 putative membrane protein YhhN [Nocardioides marinisabuli]